MLFILERPRCFHLIDDNRVVAFLTAGSGSGIRIFDAATDAEEPFHYFTSEEQTRHLRGGVPIRCVLVQIF